MPKQSTKIETLHELTIDELRNIAAETTSNYTRDLIQTVIMRYNGVSTTIIMNTLGKCRKSVVSYIHKWNKFGLECLKDNRGGNVPSTLTDEMVEDIRNVVLNTTPSQLGYEQGKWNCVLLTRYIKDKYSKKYSDTWIRKLLKALGFTYKRGIYKPTLANQQLQESFKKNVYPAGYY